MLWVLKGFRVFMGIYRCIWISECLLVFMGFWMSISFMGAMGVYGYYI